jgi:hypothetical protein
MRKLLIGSALCALLTTPVSAAEPIKLSLAQMDGLTAGATCVFAKCSQFNATWQDATAVAVGGKSKFSFASSNATAVATNVNETEQEID